MAVVVPQGMPGAGRSLRSAFIVGAPRCGTTFVSKALGRHPRICFSKPKETHFFALAWRKLERPKASGEFLRRYFQRLTDDHTTVVEGSPSHLYVPEIAQILTEFDPESRIIVCVRNPVELVYSHHAHTLYTLDEDVSDFARAWQLQEARAAGRHLPKRCREPLSLQYREIGRVGTRIEQLFGAVGRERCHVVVHDDLSADPLKSYRDLLEFLGLEYDGRTEFKGRNENREFESRFVQQFVMNPPWPFSILAVNWVLRGWRRPKIVREVRRRLRVRNTRQATRPAMPEAMRETLRREFRSEVELLEGLLNRDFSSWR
jgi:sulfotransferase family protein